MRIGVREVRGSESPQYSRVSFTDLTALKTTVCVLFELKFHHLPVAHPRRFLLHYILPLRVVWLGESPILSLRQVSYINTIIK